MQTLPRRLSHCVLEQEPFAKGMEYVSLLDHDGNRKDYCLQCWEKIERKGDGHFWKGKIPLKKREAPPDERAMELFRNSTEPKQKFVLALYLQRKHQLIQRTKTLYEAPDTGELFDVEKTSLSIEESEVLVKEMHAVIK